MSEDGYVPTADDRILELEARASVLELRLAAAERRAPIAQRLNLATIAVLVLAFVLSLFGYLVLNGAKDTADSLDRGTDLSSCRALARAPVDLATADALATILAGLDAVASGDDAALAATTDVASSTVEQIRTTRSAYDESLRLSISDPDEFLVACQEGAP